MVTGEKNQDFPRASCLVGGELTYRANNVWWSSLFPEASLLSWKTKEERPSLLRLRGFRSEHLRRESLTSGLACCSRSELSQLKWAASWRKTYWGIVQCLGTPWISELMPAPSHSESYPSPFTYAATRGCYLGPCSSREHLNSI